MRNPQAFPIDINRASEWDMLRGPGLGLITVRKLLKQRKTAKIRWIEDLGVGPGRLAKTQKYVTF